MAGSWTRMCALLRYLSPYIPLRLDSPPLLLLSKRQHVNNPLLPWPRHVRVYSVPLPRRRRDLPRSTPEGGCSDLINPCKASRLTIPVPLQISRRDRKFLISTLGIYLTAILVDRESLSQLYRSIQMTSLLRYICKQVRSCKIQTFLVINENGFERKNRGLAHGSKRAIFFTQCCRDDAERASEKF